MEKKEIRFRGFHLAFSTVITLTPQVKGPYKNYIIYQVCQAWLNIQRSEN